jgi:hypothetical protein
LFDLELPLLPSNLEGLNEVGIITRDPARNLIYSIRKAGQEWIWTNLTGFAQSFIGLAQCKVVGDKIIGHDQTSCRL